MSFSDLVHSAQLLMDEHRGISVTLLVLLWIPNVQPNQRIFPRVRTNPNPQIFCDRKWRFSVVCLQVNIY